MSSTTEGLDIEGPTHSPIVLDTDMVGNDSICLLILEERLRVTMLARQQAHRNNLASLRPRANAVAIEVLARLSMCGSVPCCLLS